MKEQKTVQELVDHFGDWMITSEEQNKKGSCARFTQQLYPYHHMFSPIQINRLKIKNRVVMAPMGNLQMCEETGRPNEKMIAYFLERAKGGVGLITTGLVPVSHHIDHSVTEPNELSYFPRIDQSRTNYAGWRDLVQGVHAHGSKLFIQITAGLGRVGAPTCLLSKHKFPVSSSFNPNFYIPSLPCLRLSDRKLTAIIKNIGQAAADSKTLGIDGIYLHGHEGYLMEQMTNPAFNRRKLGKYTNYMKFGLDAVKEIRKRVGDTYPIMYRIDLSLALNETYGEKMNQVSSLKKFKKERTVEETLRYMEELVKAGVDVFDVDLGCYDNWWLPHPPAGMPAGCFLEVSKLVKDYFREKKIKSNAGVAVPIVAVGKLGYPDIAEKALREEDCDMIMLGRPLLADPYWCKKAYAGRVDEIRPCIGCQEGCVNEFVEGGHIQCTVNARTGFEEQFPEQIQTAEKKKRIAVVGGGPAGIEFALTALKRGHLVELYEKEEKLGGKVNLGSVPKIKFDFLNYLTYLQVQVEKQSQKNDFTIHLKTEATIELLQTQSYDAIVFANGTKLSKPAIEGMDKITVLQAENVLSNVSLIQSAQNITIVGGGVVGCEIAYWLAYEQNRNVTVIEQNASLMDGVCTANRGHLIHYMEKRGVKLINCASVQSFEQEAVIIERSCVNVPDPYNTWQPVLPKNIKNPMEKKIGDKKERLSIPTELVILATGSRPSDELYYEAINQHIAKEIYQIGDSMTPGKVLEASRAAYRLAVWL